MFISYFVRGKECHISTSEFSYIYKVSENRLLADKIITFIDDTISNNSDKKIEKVIYSKGPGSFTTVRIMNSIVKGMYISDPNIEFIGVSSFLTYLSVVSEMDSSGLIAIPTMRGDYFACEYTDNKLQKPEICSIDNINAYKNSIYFDEDNVFANRNLAESQNNVLQSRIFCANQGYTSSTLNVDYVFNPEYTY